MKPFFFSLASTLKRVLLSWPFWGAVIGFAGLNGISIYQELAVRGGMETSVLYLYEISNYASFWVLFLLFAAIPGAVLFCGDWENRYLRFWVVRSSKLLYGSTTAIVCFLSAVLVVFLGEGLFLGGLSLFYPFFSQETANGFSLPDTIYASVANAQEIGWYYFIQTAGKAFSAGFFATAALWLSTKITNVFVALTSPIILYYLLENMLILWKAPSYLQIASLSKGHVQMGDSPLHTLLYYILLFSACAGIFGVLFTLSAKRRLEDG